MGFLRNVKGSFISDHFMLDQNLGSLREGTMVDVAMFPEYLSIKNRKQEITLKYTQITDVYHGLQKNVALENKSVIGRAFAGGFLFGGAGAIVGALSANNRVKKKRLVLIISYTSSDGGESFITFEDTRKYKGKKLAKKLMEFARVDMKAKYQKKYAL